MNKVIKTTSSSTVFIPDEDLFEVTNVLKKFNLTKTVFENQWNIPTGIIGTLVTNSLKIVIQPKIIYLDTSDYLRLVINDDEQFKDDEGIYGRKKGSNISKFIINSFINELKSVIKEGIPRHYKKIDMYTDYFSGSVNLTESFFRYQLNTKPIISANIEKLNIDYFHARVIKSAYNKVLSISRKYSTPSVTSALSGIPDSNIKRVENGKHFLKKTRSNKSFVQAYELAALILNDMNTAHIKDDYSISLLINANNIFEEFIYNLLTSAFPRDSFAKQHSIIAAHSKNKEILARPDVLYTGPSKIIMDMKNKDFYKSITSDNYHQMISYMNTYGINTSVLIYPDYKDSDEQLYKIHSDDKLKLYAISIDIRNRNFSPFLKKIAHLIQFG